MIGDDEGVSDEGVFIVDDIGGEEMGVGDN